MVQRRNEPVALNCPKCKTRTLLSASEVGPTGRLVQCPRCRTTWLARHFDVDVYGPAARHEPPPGPRQSPIIDGEIVTPKPRPAATRPARRTVRPGPAAVAGNLGRYGFATAATILILTLIAVVLLTPAVSALPWLGGMLGTKSGIALRAVQSRTLTLRGTDALLVEGELFNATDHEVDVPAVRVVLRSADAEVYSWLVEPSTMRVAAGAAIGFRSALADPPAGADRIAVSLAARPGAPIGGR